MSKHSQSVHTARDRGKQSEEQLRNAREVRHALYRHNGWDVSRAPEIFPSTNADSNKLLLLLWSSVILFTAIGHLVGASPISFVMIGLIYTAAWILAPIFERKRNKRTKRAFEETVREYSSSGLVASSHTEVPKFLNAHVYYLGQDPLLAATLIELLPKLTPADQSLFQANDTNNLAFVLNTASMSELRLSALYAIDILMVTACLPAVQAVLREDPSSVNSPQVFSLAQQVEIRLIERQNTMKRHDRLLRPASADPNETLLRPTSFANGDLLTLLQPAVVVEELSTAALLRPVENS